MAGTESLDLHHALMESFGELSEDLTEPLVDRRLMCHRCVRPASTCLCVHLPEKRLPTKTHLLILQHPREETRGLRTVPLLEACLEEESVTVYRGKKFPVGFCKELDEVLQRPDTVLLFPAKDAVDVLQAPPPLVGRPRTLIVLDGTWKQAKGMLVQNQRLRDVPAVMLSSSQTSAYVIRTQPTDAALSTLESAALALSMMDNAPAIFEAALRPLKGLCDIQIERFGAQIHHSKETILREQEAREKEDAEKP